MSGRAGAAGWRPRSGLISPVSARSDGCAADIRPLIRTIRWTLHDLPGPGFVDLPDFSVESSYYTWVDQHNALGLGEDVPMATGNLFDGVHALVEDAFVTLRIPYPMGFYSKGFEGRIDDPEAGWKGRGIWVPSGDRTPWLKEGGKGSKPLVVQFQLRPGPLAK